VKRKSTTTRKTFSFKKVLKTNKKKNPSKKKGLKFFSRRVILTTSAALIVALGVFLNLDKGSPILNAAVVVTAVEGESMTWNPAGTVYNDTGASSAKAIKVTKASVGTSTALLEGTAEELRVVARGDQCAGAPQLQVKLDGVVIGTQDVTATSWTQYTFPVSALAGSHSLELGFTNPKTSTFLFSTCIRALYVDKAEFFQPLTDPSPSPTPSPTSTPPVGSIPAGSEYVAMGDSYSSGWGADRTPSNLTRDASVYDTTKCKHNTKNGNQYLLARDMGLSLIDASCGGASTRHLLTVSQFSGVPPQINLVTSNTKLVTMTIGGNDTGLLYLLTICIKTSGTCNPNGTTSHDVDKATAALPTNLNLIYQQIADKAPDAKVRQAGYPLIVSAPGEPFGTCKSWLNASDQQLFHAKLTAVNNKIKETIEAFATRTGRDFKYVDPLATSSPFMQRDNGQMLDGCSTSLKRYMNGTNDGALTYGGWHPNIDGQKYYYQIYRSSL
jgi:hypothetical protein